jgi:VanZ family protein
MRYRSGTVWWVAAVGFWAVVIFILSTRGFGIVWSLRLLDGTLRLFGLVLSPPSLFHVERIVRKLAHVAVYAVLTLVLYRTLRPSTENSWHSRSAFISVLGSAAYGASDGVHQLFVPGRHGSVWDWYIDMIGAVLGISAVYFWTRLPPLKSKRNAARTESTEAK